MKKLFLILLFSFSLFAEFDYLDRKKIDLREDNEYFLYEFEMILDTNNKYGNNAYFKINGQIYEYPVGIEESALFETFKVKQTKEDKSYSKHLLMDLKREVIYTTVFANYDKIAYGIFSNTLYSTYNICSKTADYNTLQIYAKEIIAGDRFKQKNPFKTNKTAISKVRTILNKKKEY
jgi:hypothetical protein